MKSYVYIGYMCYYDYCEIWKSVECVFEKEVDAMKWVENLQPSETDWREYSKIELILENK